VSDPPAPPQVEALAAERSRARASRDWTRADDLRDRIEAGGWRVEDDGLDYSLRPLQRADIVEDGELSYGSLEAVPSLLHEPATLEVSVIIVGREHGATISAQLEALASLQRSGMQVVVVLPRGLSTVGPCDEVVRTVEPFAPGDAIGAALRRTRGRFIVVLDQDRILAGDAVTPLLEGLADATVAVIGADGLVSAELRRFRPGGPGDVTALRSGCYAFRRADAVERGPLDGRLGLADSVATWWSLVLRDEGPGLVPRRALAIELPLGPPPAAGDSGPQRDRQARRDSYRIADRFADRRDLAKPEQDVPGLPRDGADQHDQGDGADKEGDAA